MTRIDIISGFLGAGKTTWLSKWLKHPLYRPFTAKTIILENEFGEVNLDAGLLKDTGLNVSELTAGCICCTISGDFSEKLNELLDTYKPDRIIIEPSGVAKLSEVIEAIKHIQRSGKAQLGQAMTVIDATAFELYLANFPDFFKDQISHAHQLLITRDEHLSASEGESITQSIRKLNPQAKINFSSAVSLDALVLSMDASFDAFSRNDFFQIVKAPHHHHHHHEHDTFVSHQLTLTETFSEVTLRAKLEKLIAHFPSPEGIVRIKGIVNSGEKSLKVDYTGSTLTVTPWEATDLSLLCFIGQNIALDEINAVFNASL